MLLTNLVNNILFMFYTKSRYFYKQKAYFPSEI